MPDTHSMINSLFKSLVMYVSVVCLKQIHQPCSLSKGGLIRANREAQGQAFPIVNCKMCITVLIEESIQPGDCDLLTARLGLAHPVPTP